MNGNRTMVTQFKESADEVRAYTISYFYVHARDDDRGKIWNYSPQICELKHPLRRIMDSNVPRWKSPLQPNTICPTFLFSIAGYNLLCATAVISFILSDFALLELKCFLAHHSAFYRSCSVYNISIRFVESSNNTHRKERKRDMKSFCIIRANRWLYVASVN